MQRALHNAAITTHGYSKVGNVSPTYRVWCSLFQRCGNRDGNHPEYADVRVCKRWTGTSGFIHFLEDVGERPAGRDRKGHSLYSIGRFSDTGDYCPSNCEWMTRSGQFREARHKRASQTHCKYGHRLTTDNIGTRGCKVCRRESCTEYRLRQTQRKTQR